MKKKESLSCLSARTAWCGTALRKKIRAEQAQRSVSSENYRRRDSWILRPPPAYILLYIYIYIYNNAPLPFFIA